MPAENKSDENKSLHLRIEDATIVPAQLDWPSAVGNFILSFGAMEWEHLVFLKSRLPTEDFEKVRNLHFRDRMKATTEYLANAGYPTAVQDDFSRIVEALEPIRKLRNHLAHGSISIIQDEDMAQGRKPSKVTISLPRDLDRPFDEETWHLGFSELCDGLQRLYRLSEEMSAITRLEGPRSES